ncbi:MAG: HAD family hydrolase [Actinomycetota bacterium]|nr:HAD family hydrolase [Actinomycetota bacterium]
MANDSHTELAAVLWDLDGTLVDTEPLWMDAEHELADAHDKAWTQQDGLNLVGNSLLESGIYIRHRLGIDMEPAEIVDYLVDCLARRLREEEVVWRPGARTLIESLHAEEVPLALVTMSYAAIADPIVSQLPFKAVVTGDAVTHGKPHPEPYLRAAEMLGVDPAACIAIEDSGTGAASANAAGCQVLVVPHFVNVPEAHRRTQLKTLEGVTPADLRALLI